MSDQDVCLRLLNGADIHPLLEIPEHILDLRQRRAQVVRDLLRQQVRLGETRRILEALVAQPEEVETHLVAGEDLLINASNAMIQELKLPVTNVLAGVANTQFYAPGAILAVNVDRESPIARGFSAPTPGVWFEGGPAFEITDPAAATAVASYPASGNPLLSGWLPGGEKLNGRAALVDVRRGKGHVVLYGFRPQYRRQTKSTYPFIWGAVLE